MMEKRYEFDELILLSAVAIGALGKRTFFIIIGQKYEWVRVWLEKEQLQALALAIDQFLLTLAQERHLFPEEPEEPPLSDDVPLGFSSAELKSGQITLGFDKGIAELDFMVHLVGPQEDSAAVNCRVTLGQLKKFSGQAKNLVAAGRPRCNLCGGPIDPEGHTCPRQN